jgi:hypothetical protein
MHVVMHHARMGLLVLGHAVFGCGGAPTAAPVSVGPKSAEVTGQVVDITRAGGTHSIPDNHVIVELANKSTRACTVDGLALSWPLGGHAEKTGLHLTLPAGTSTRITHAIQGDASLGMKIDSTVVTVTTVACP